MVKMLKVFLHIALIVSLLYACSDTELPHNEEMLIVEGYIDDGGFPVVMLTTSMAVNTNEQRLDTLKMYTEMVNIPLIVEDYYGLREFVQNVVDNIDGRCYYCYRSRLEKTVQYAKENGYDSFTTTLLVSPYQKHEMIIKVCEELSKEYDIEFVYFDFRVGFREGQQMARDAGLYMQKYCGCVFSEEEAERQREERKSQKNSN